MQPIKTTLPGLTILEPRIFPDERGFFTETYRREWHAEAGIPAAEEFIQDNHSRSSRGVVRGMHFHIGAGVAKLVRCARGRIVDVNVDLREGLADVRQVGGRSSSTTRTCACCTSRSASPTASAC